MNDKAISDCKDIIRQLDTNIKKEEELNKQLADKNLAISKGKQNHIYIEWFIVVI